MSNKTKLLIMKLEELLKRVNENGRELKVISIEAQLPRLGLVEISGGRFMKEINLQLWKDAIKNMPEGECFVIGRGSGVNYYLPDNRFFSRYHCAILCMNNDLYWVIDCSLNGTKVI